MAENTKLSWAPEKPEQSTTLNRYVVIVALVATIAVAFGLRVYLLDGQSLWYDEGVSLAMAPRDLATITANAAADIHPPLYYYLLHFWTALVGLSEFGARYLSLIYGVALVAVVFQIGRRPFGDLAGLSGAFFAATTPFLIYYSQEARMYMQVALLAALSMCLFTRLVVASEKGRESPSALNWLAYTVVTSLTLYSHYFAFTVPVLQNAHFWLFSGQQRSLWRRWLASQTVVGISFLPWLIVSLGQLGGWPSVSEPFSLDALLRRVFLVFSFGLSWDAAATPLRELAVLVVLAAALLHLLLDRRREALRNLALLILYGLVPVLVMYVLSIRRPMYNPKFLLLATPAFYCGLGLGVASLVRGFQWLHQRFLGPGPRWLRAALSAVLVTVVLGGASYGPYHSAAAYYFNPKYARDDYRGLVRYITANARPGDAIVLNAPGQIEIFDYYYKGDLPRLPLPQQRPIDEKHTEEELIEITAAHQRVWLVLWAAPEADPRGFIEGWLDRRAYKALNQWFGSVRLCLYTTRSADDAIQKDAQVLFGEHITLLGYEIGGSQVRPGETLPLTLKWSASAPIAERYTVFIHLLDPSESICGQRDSEPVGGTRPTTSWPPGETIEDRYAVPVLPGVPPGQYTVEVGLYQPQTGQRLPVRSQAGEMLGDRYLIGPVLVGRASSPPDPGLLGFEQRSSAVFDGNLRLIGYSVDALGHPPGYVDYSNADILHLTLFWQTSTAPASDYKVQVLLQTGSTGKPAVDYLGSLASGVYPPRLWQPGEVIRDQHKIPLAGLRGEYTLSIALRQPGHPEPVDLTPGSATRYLQLGKIRVGER